MRVKGRAVLLTVSDDGSLPTEFRLFAKGWNDTSKGRFLFDAAAAKAVMAEYQKHGADIMLDLEHLSLESPTESRNFDPDSRGWCQLELRNGELWAVNVTWSPDGAARLTEKRQRYISPAFDADRKTKRILSLVNVAITALPATHGLTPLVAASSERQAMADEQTVDIAKVAEGMGIDLESIAKVLGLESGASLEDLSSAVTALGSKLQAIAGLGNPAAPPEGAADPAAMAATPEEEEQQKEMSALRATVLRETGAPTPMQALAEIATWKASHLKLEQEREKLAREKSALEAGERKTLAAELVKLGKETPHTSGLAYGKLAKHLADMPLVELRDRVASFRRTGGPPKPPTPPSTGDEHGLTERELEKCRAKKVDPAAYAKTKAAIAARSTRATAQQGG